MSAPMFMVETDRSLPVVDLFLCLRTGSADAAVGQEGLQSLAMRAMRRGTSKRDADTIDEAIDTLGADLSVMVDTTTTTIHATVLRRNLDRFLPLLAEILVEHTIPEDEFALLARQTRAAIIDARNDDRTLAGRFYRKRMFQGHPFGRSSGGTLKSLETLKSGDARAHLQNVLCADNLVIGASGDVDLGQLRGLIETHLAPILARTHEVPRTEIPEPSPLPRGRHLIIVDKPERTQTQIFMGALGTTPKDKDHHALVVGNAIFGGSFTSRLMKEVRSKRGWSYGASSRLGRDRVRESFTMWTFPSAADAPACVSLELKLLEQLVDKGVTSREVGFARDFITRGHAFEIDTAEKRLGLEMDEVLTPLPKGFHAKYLSKIGDVTADSANAALRKRLSADDLLITIVASAETLRGPLEKAIPKLESVTVVKYDDDALY